MWDRWEREERRILAPTILFYDISNILSSYVRHGVLSAQTVNAILQAARSLPIQLVEEPEIQFRALELSERLDLPVGCDPHYLALAEKLDKELWTYDRRLAVAVNRPGTAPRVRWIGKKQEMVSI